MQSGLKEAKRIAFNKFDRFFNLTKLSELEQLVFERNALLKEIALLELKNLQQREIEGFTAAEKTIENLDTLTTEVVKDGADLSTEAVTANNNLQTESSYSLTLAYQRVISAFYELLHPSWIDLSNHSQNPQVSEIPTDNVVSPLNDLAVSTTENEFVALEISPPTDFKIQFSAEEEAQINNPLEIPAHIFVDLTPNGIPGDTTFYLGQKVQLELGDVPEYTPVVFTITGSTDAKAVLVKSTIDAISPDKKTGVGVVMRFSEGDLRALHGQGISLNHNSVILKVSADVNGQVTSSHFIVDRSLTKLDTNGDLMSEGWGYAKRVEPPVVATATPNASAEPEAARLAARPRPEYRDKGSLTKSNYPDRQIVPYDAEQWEKIAAVAKRPGTDKTPYTAGPIEKLLVWLDKHS